MVGGIQHENGAIQLENDRNQLNKNIFICQRNGRNEAFSAQNASECFRDVFEYGVFLKLTCYLTPYLYNDPLCNEMDYRLL